MTQPPGFENSSYPSHFCQLKKAIYGLKQAPRAWYNELKAHLLSMGFFTSESDNSLFIMKDSVISVYILVYVDDIIVTGNNNTVVQQVISSLASRFSIKDLGHLHHFLGVEVLRNSDCLFLSQPRYVVNILQGKNMLNCKAAKTPMSSSEKYCVLDGYPPIDDTKYRQVVGKLQYLSFTRPDISYSVNKLSQFVHSPSTLHWKAVKRVLRYLEGTITHGLYLRKSTVMDLVMYSDAD